MTITTRKSKIFNSKKQVVKFIKDNQLPITNFEVEYAKPYCKQCKNKKIILNWYEIKKE